MDKPVPFASQAYFLFLSLLLFARGADFLSTWIATPNLILEANPIARRLRWKWGIPLNVALCVGFARWPLIAIIIGTTSALVAARNFQLAWLMRSHGEENYRNWSVEGAEHLGRYSFVGCNPRAVIRQQGDRVEVLENGRLVESFLIAREANRDRSQCVRDGLEVVERTLKKYRAVTLPFLPRFAGG